MTVAPVMMKMTGMTMIIPMTINTPGAQAPLAVKASYIMKKKQKALVISGDGSNMFTDRLEAAIETLKLNPLISEMAYQFSSCVWANQIYYSALITYLKRRIIMAKTKKRTKIKLASVYFEDQIEDLDKIGQSINVSRSELLRDGADIIVSKNKHLLKKDKKQAS